MSEPASNPDVRWRQRLQNFNQAFSQLSKAVDLSQQRPLSELEQLGLIHAFEFTHELAWKTLKDFLEQRGVVEIYGSKDATRLAFSAGLIADGEVWMAMIKSRNQTSHTYDCAIAGEIARAIIAAYFPAFEKFQIRFTQLEREPA